MSLLQDIVGDLSAEQIEALKSAREDNGQLTRVSPQTEFDLLKKRLAERGYLTPIGVSVREYLVGGTAPQTER